MREFGPINPERAWNQRMERESMVTFRQPEQNLNVDLSTEPVQAGETIGEPKDIFVQGK